MTFIPVLLRQLNNWNAATEPPDSAHGISAKRKNTEAREY
jgi:hypothetical protein